MMIHKRAALSFFNPVKLLLSSNKRIIKTFAIVVDGTDSENNFVLQHRCWARKGSPENL